MVKDIINDEFQYTVSELLIRNKSILDILTKFQQSNADVNRSVAKAATQCGCISINAKKQIIPEDGDLEKAKESTSSHLEGAICSSCREIIEKEIGKNLFYLTALCDTLDISLYDVIIKELDRVKLLGKYNLR